MMGKHPVNDSETNENNKLGDSGQECKEEQKKGETYIYVKHTGHNGNASYDERRLERE